MERDQIKFFSLHFALRMFLIGVADYLDKQSETGLKYTDIDYQVFSDAATKVYLGGSPYEAHTYRYTPIVAYLCLVNNFIHPLAAKVIFCGCDILMGYILWTIIDAQISKNKDHVIGTIGQEK